MPWRQITWSPFPFALVRYGVPRSLETTFIVLQLDRGIKKKTPRSIYTDTATRQLTRLQLAMPPSGSRNGASNDAASEQSSMGATTSTSPQISTSKGNGRAKRSVDTNTQEPSSLRRSKRLKSDEGPKVSTSPLPAKSGVNGRSPGSEKEKNSNTPVINSQEDTAVISLKQEVKKEGEEKEELSATTPVKPSRKRGVGVAKPRPVEVDEKVEEEKEEDTKKIVSKKTSTTRKRTTKKKQEELLLMPLAARTQGLRMFVGAHVSAAKG